MKRLFRFANIAGVVIALLAVLPLVGPALAANGNGGGGGGGNPPIDTTLSALTLGASSVTMGNSVMVSGSLAVGSGGTLSGHTIRLEWSTDGGATFSDDGSALTNGGGSYSVTYTPSIIGTYNFRAHLIPGNAGNSGYRDSLSSTSAALTVNPSDTTRPVVIITAPAEGGYYKTSTLPALAYTVADNDSSPSVVVTGWSTVEGAHTVVVTATDAAGNVGSASVNYIVDNTPPVVNITGPAVVLQGASVSAIVVASDNFGLAVDPSGSVILDTSTPGPRTIAATAVDKAGNSTTASFSYTVWGVIGPFAPLQKNGNGAGQFKAGITIPAKFQLTDRTSLITTAAGKVNIGSAGADFRWDSTSQQYIANVKTAAADAGKTVSVVLTVNGVGGKSLLDIQLKVSVRLIFRGGNLLRYLLYRMRRGPGS